MVKLNRNNLALLVQRAAIQQLRSAEELEAIWTQAGHNPGACPGAQWSRGASHALRATLEALVETNAPMLNELVRSP